MVSHPPPPPKGEILGARLVVFDGVQILLVKINTVG